MEPSEVFGDFIERKAERGGSINKGHPHEPDRVFFGERALVNNAVNQKTLWWSRM